MALKVKKIVGGLLALLLAAVLLLICIFFFWLGPTVKMVAERIGSKALGTPLTINELTINPRSGTLHMTGFAVANHQVFGRTNAISLASMDIAMDVNSIFTPTIVVHRVQLESPYFVYEQDDATDNITRFIDSITEFAGIDPDKPEEPQQKEDSEPKAVLIEQLEINDIQFHLANTKTAYLDIDIGIEQLAVSMTNGIVQLKNLHVSNPARLATPNLFTLDRIRIDMDPETIYSDALSIRDVQIDRPCAYLEHNTETDTVTEFMEIAGRLATPGTHAAGQTANDAPPETGDKQSPAKPAPVQLHNLLVNDIQLKLLDSAATNAPSDPYMLAGIASITLQLVDGKVQINGITVPNPEGYQATNLFRLARIDVAIDPGSIFSEQVNIRRILIDSPLINVEQKETSGNVTDLQTTLMGFVPPEGVAEGAPTPEALPQSGERPEPIPLDEQPAMLHELVVTNMMVTLKLPAATNETAMLGGRLKEFKPMEKLSMDKLNPLARQESTPATNAAERTDLALDLLFFDELNVRPLDGELTVRGLGVANTPRFASKHLATIEKFSIQLDTDTLQSGVLVIKEVLIESPRVDYERQISTDNIEYLQQTIQQALTRRAEYTHKEPESGEKTDLEPETKVIISHLLVQNGLVRAKLSALPAAPIPLPDIELKDLGKAEGGASIGQALSNIGGTFYDSILGAISGTTGFAVDALKGAGALTLGTLGKATGIKPDKDEQVTDEERIAAPGQPGTEEERTSPTRERRNPFKRRHPGRVF